MSTPRERNPKSLDRFSMGVARSFFEAAPAMRKGLRLDRLSPTGRVVLSFALLIFAGAFLLWFPICVAEGQEALSFIDALFTSCSAVCVTGLSTIDVGVRFSLYGQGVLLALIQLGGLGFLTLSTGVTFSLGFRSSMLTRAAVAEVWGGRSGEEIRGLLRNLFLTTLLVECVGAVVLTWRFAALDGLPLGTACWFGVFHSVSAFCNAGFSVFSTQAGHLGNSLEAYAQDPFSNLAVMSLIVMGGLGFVVIEEIIRWVRKLGRQRLSLHTKIVLSTSATLTLGGALLFFFCEWGGVFAGRPWYEGLWPSLFQSVTARTAGFNTVPFGLLSGPTLMLIMVLMFVGGNPASCAGGIKTTTAFVIYKLTRARLARQRNPTAFGREISVETVTRAATLILIALGVVAVATGVLMVLTPPEAQAHNRSGVFMDILFETISALGTVGLSTGATNDLSALGKLVVILAMFVGRLGPLTIFVALAQAPRVDKVRAPEASVIVG
ncbi:MAG: potassium-transporting ATPase subunit KdpA [Planctomycetes bacterium]|nr:potassium-transporting ATPase subunit KdpA [Planctomycetota bacterium]